MIGADRPYRRQGRPSLRARGGQGGYTLLELILVLALTMLIIGPLTAWMILVLGQQPVQRDGMLATAHSDLLRASFPDDVVVAGAADDYQGAQAVGGQWDTWRQACAGGVAGQGGRQLVVLLSQAVEPVKVIYSVAPADDGDGSSIWRTECSASTGVLVGERQILSGVIDDPARTRVICSSPTLANGDPDAPCRQVRLVVATEVGRTVELSATRRTDTRSLTVDATGNFLPVARIDVVTQRRLGSGSQATEVALSAAASRDPDGAVDGSDLSFRWELPTGPDGSGAPIDAGQTGATPTITLPSAGDYWIRLTVTDSRGGSTSTYRLVTVQNRQPIVSLAATPLTARATVDTITLDASGTQDPDGSIVAWNWVVSGADDPTRQVTFSTPTVTLVPEAWAIGGLVVELNVLDDDGATSSATTFVEVLAADGTPPTDPTDPTIPTDPSTTTVPGSPVARATVTPQSSTVAVLDASASTGDIASYQWTLGLLAGTATGQIANATFPGPGTYAVRLVVTDTQGRTGTWAGQAVLAGAVAAPANVRTEGSILRWDPRPGARRYLVDLESTSNGCARSLLNQAVAASENPTYNLPPALCVGAGTRTLARVGVEASAGGTVAWSDYLDVTGALP